MEFLVFFILAFVLVYLFYLVTVILQKKRYEKFKSSNQVLYFKNKYKLDINKLNINLFINVISLLNAFIIATVFTVSMIFDSMIIQLLVGFILITILTYVVYDIYGRILRKKEKNV